MAAAEVVPTSSQLGAHAWDEIEAQVMSLTTRGGATSSTSSGTQAASVGLASIQERLERLRARHLQLAALLAGEASPVNAEGGADMQRMRETSQENIVLRTQVYQNQGLVAEKDSEVLKLTKQVEAAKRQCENLERQISSPESRKTQCRTTSTSQSEDCSLALARLEISQRRERLDELRRRIAEKETVLATTRHELQDLASGPKRRLQAERCEELRQELAGVEAQKVVFEKEVADCQERLSTTRVERRELEQRLLLLRQSYQQLEEATAVDAADAATLRQQLAEYNAECRRREEEARRDFDEMATLRMSSAGLDASQVSWNPSKKLDHSLSNKMLAAHPDLAEQLRSATSQNHNLRDKLQQTLPPPLAPRTASSPYVLKADVPEATPEVGTPPAFRSVSEPAVDSAIFALESQMRAMAVQNEALERKFARNVGSHVRE